jgi:hypothetical protein
MPRDPFKKLISKLKRNALYLRNGEWVINSSTNKRRMSGFCENSAKWQPAKLLLTADDLRNVYDKQDGKCYWTQMPLELDLLYKDHPEWYSKHPKTPSVDRLDDQKDYTPDNVVLCLLHNNLGRNTYPADKYREFLDEVDNGRLIQGNSPVYIEDGKGHSGRGEDV